MLTVSCAGVNNNLACGDVVVHPTKKWPWLSRMSSQTTALVRICDKCDNIVQVVPSGFGYNTFDRCQECNEDSNVKTYIALDSATLLSAGSKSTGLKESKTLLELKNDTYLESVSTYHLVSFTNYPKNGDSSPLDGTEKLVSACSTRFSFVENNGVYRLDGSQNYGTIKNVRCSVDGFILPNSKFILTKVDNLRLRPTSVLQKLAHGSTVPIIYQHWLGQCYSFVARWYFRLNDGKEFYTENTDAQGFSDFLFKGVTGQSICQAFDLIPGEKVQINSALIQRAHWTETGSISGDLSHGRNSATNLERLLLAHENVVSNAETNSGNTILCTSTSSQPKLDDKIAKICADNKSTLSEMKETDEEANCSSWRANAVQVEGIFLKFQVRKIMVSWLKKLTPDNRAANNIDEFPSRSEIDEGEIKDILYLDIPNYSNMTEYEPFNRFVVDYDESIDRANILTAEVWRKNLFSSETDSTNCDVEDNEIETEIQKDRVAFVAPICSKTLVDVLWEDGTYETGISSDCLKPRMISGYPPSKEFYPAMYIFVPRKAKKRLKLPENIDLPRFVAEKDFFDDQISLNKRNHFGIVRRANNNEKMVLADIFLFDIDSYRIGECDRPILVSNNHPLSFYEISSYAEYNYFPGVLVSKTQICDKNKAKSGQKQLNVGWARRKNVDGSVTVIWAEECLGATDMEEKENCSLHHTNFLGGNQILRYRQEILQAWQITQIKVQTSSPPKNANTTVDKEIISNDVNAEEDSYEKDEYVDDMSEEYQPKGYYSPSEYDMEEFDTSSQDINLLSPPERKKCVVLVVAVLHHIIPRLLKLLTLVRHYLSDHSYRKQLCRFLINYQDILSCLSNVDLADEKYNMQMCFKHVVYDEEKSVVDDYESKLVDNPHYKNGFDSWKRCLRRDRLIFQISDRLYDFTGAVQMLESDMQALSKKNMAKRDNETEPDEYRSKKSLISETTTVVRKASERKISVVMNLDKEKGEEFRETLQEMSKEAIDDKIQESQRNDPKVIEKIENLLSTVKTAFSLLTALFTLATINEPAAESVRDFLSSLDYGDNKEHLCDWSTIDMNDLPNAATCHRFLLLILANDEKVTNLPCFCLFHQKDEDLNRAIDRWGQTENGANSSPKCLIDGTMQMLEKQFKTNDSLSMFNECYDLLQICNDVGDSICFSVLSINCRLLIVLKAFFDEDLQDMFAKIPKRIIENLDLDRIKFRDTSPSREEKMLIDKQSVVEEIFSSETRNVERLEFLSRVPEVHRFFKKKLSDTNIPKSFVVAVNRDVRLLKNSLPEGIYVKAYYDRMDLFSCMIIGPLGTPYADCPFFFDVRLKDTYPNRPPHVFFKSMSASLNPNLYEDGMVCLSLLGTWEGNETELWTPSSTLLQVFISIQSLILVPEPYYNEPGFEKDKATKSGRSRSRDYNEMIILRSLESFRKALQSPPDPFKAELANHIRKNIDRITKTVENYYRDSSSSISSDSSSLPFPLFPVTRGFVTFVQNLANGLVSEMNNFLAANPV